MREKKSVQLHVMLSGEDRRKLGEIAAAKRVSVSEALRSLIVPAASSAPKKRDAVLRVRLSKAERQMLGDIAQADGVSMSDVVRGLVRRVWRPR